jgi:hypothetical protein
LEKNEKKMKNFDKRSLKNKKTFDKTKKYIFLKNKQLFGKTKKQNKTVKNKSDSFCVPKQGPLRFWVSWKAGFEFFFEKFNIF